MKNRVTLLIGIAVVFAMPSDLDAQGLLRGLRDRVEQSVGNAVGSFLGNDNSSSDSNYSKDTPASSSRQVGGIGGQLQQQSGGSTVWQGEVKPSTATTARALFNELPSFPTAEQLVNNNETVRDNFLSKVYAVRARIEELKNVSSSDIDSEIAAYQMMFGSVNMSQVNALQQGGQAEQMMLMNQIFGGMDVDEVSAALSIDMERVEEIEAELEKYEDKQNLTDAEKARIAQLTNELLELTSEQFETMMGIGSNTEALLNSYTTQSNSMVGSGASDIVQKCQDYITRFAELQANVQLRNATAQSSQTDLSALQNIYKQIWAENNQSKIAELYSQADKFLVNSAQSRLEANKATFKTIEGFLSEAEQLVAGSAGTMYAGYMKNAPLEAVDLCAAILANSFESNENVQVGSVLKSRVNIPLEAGDELILGESNYVFMMEQAGLSSLFGTPKSEDTLVEEFLRGAVFLVYDKNGNPFKVANGQRTAINDNGPINFYKSLQDVAPSGDIPMKSLNKKINFSNDVLTLPDGSVYYPIAIQRTNDWLNFIIEEADGGLTKCMYRL